MAGRREPAEDDAPAVNARTENEPVQLARGPAPRIPDGRKREKLFKFIHKGETKQPCCASSYCLAGQVSEVAKWTSIAVHFCLESQRPLLLQLFQAAEASPSSADPRPC